MPTTESRIIDPRQLGLEAPVGTSLRTSEATKSDVKVDRDPPYILDYSDLPPNADDFFPPEKGEQPISRVAGEADAVTRRMVEHHRGSNPTPKTVFDAMPQIRELHRRDPLMKMEPHL